MKTMLSAKIQRQDSKRKRFEKRTDELARYSAEHKARKVALIQRLAKRDTSNIEHQKGQKP